jgi:hypothetical protein
MVRRVYLFVALPLLLSTSAVRAADPPQLLPADGKNVLDDAYAKQQKDNLIDKLLSGAPSADPNNKQHTEALDVAAQWYTYRLTWGLEAEPGKINGLFNELDNLVFNRLHEGGKKSASSAELFTLGVIAHADEVLKANKKPIVRINAARVLYRLTDRNDALAETEADVLARFGAEGRNKLADALAPVIEEPGTAADGARYWALKTLRNLLALPQPTQTLTREHEEKALAAVLKFLKDRNGTLPAEASPNEFEGFRMLRREAVRALAQGHYPRLADDKGRPALELLKIAVVDGVEPPPRLDERVEAAIGVARARADAENGYQPDYAAQQLGIFVYDFIVLYNEEKKRAQKDQPVRPWAVYASRLYEALDAMNAQTKDPRVAAVVEASGRMLAEVEKGTAGGDRLNPSDLKTLLLDDKAPKGPLYRGADDAKVTPGGKPPAKTDKPDEKKDK